MGLWWQPNVSCIVAGLFMCLQVGGLASINEKGRGVGSFVSQIQKMAETAEARPYKRLKSSGPVAEPAAGGCRQAGRQAKVAVGGKLRMF